jgi:hypothetical protein
MEEESVESIDKDEWQQEQQERTADYDDERHEDTPTPELKSRLQCAVLGGHLTTTLSGWASNASPGPKSLGGRASREPLAVSRGLKCVVVESGQSFGHRDPARNVDPRLRATPGSEHHCLGLVRHDTHECLNCQGVSHHNERAGSAPAGHHLP